MDRGHSVALWLAGRAVEETSIEGWSGGVIRVGAAGFPAGLSLRSVGSALRLATAIPICWLRMRANRPDVLLAMGGYGSVGPALAARMCGLPVVLHEANAVPGRAVSSLAGLATRIAVSFPDVPGLPEAKTELTGFPLRKNLKLRFPGDALDQGVFTVLIMGGSQGAHCLNEVGSAAVCSLHARGVPLQVVHLAGKQDVEEVRSRYKAAGVRHMVSAFLKDMGLAYGAADVAVSRAGAATCMELAACSVPALLVPLPSARRDHQTANARVLAAAGGADIVAQKDFSASWLSEYLDTCRRDGTRLDGMKQALAPLAVPDAAERLAALVEGIGAGSGNPTRTGEAQG